MKRKVKSATPIRDNVQTAGGNFSEQRIIGYVLVLKCGHTVRLDTFKPQPPTEAVCAECARA